MSLPLASAARIGPVEFVASRDGDLARPVLPPPPEPLDGEDPEAFAARSIEWRDGPLAAHTVARAAFDRRLAAACETQAWADVLRPDADPTIFVCRQIPWSGAGPTWERWCSVRDQHSLSTTEAAGTLLRMALVSVRGGDWPASFKVPPLKEHMLPDPTNKARTIPSGLGKIAGPELLTAFAEILKDGDLCGDVIDDLGLQIHSHRMQAPGN